METLTSEMKQQAVDTLFEIANDYRAVDNKLQKLLSHDLVNHFILSHQTMAWMITDQANRWSRIAAELQATFK
jgi:hypothetical protein